MSRSVAKEIVLVRHGQCVTNKTDIYQAGDQFEKDPLSEQGVADAKNLAQRFVNEPVDDILSSSYLRAVQTAKPISQVAKAAIIVPVLDGQIVDKSIDDANLQRYKSLLREHDLPSEVAGLPFRDPVAVGITDQITAQRFTPDWHYSDEENLFDRWNRAGEIIQYLENRPEERIVVVSHGGILKAVIARLMFGADPSLSLLQKMTAYQNFATTTWWANAGIVPLRYGEEAGWQWPMADTLHLKPELFARPVSRPDIPDTLTTDSGSVHRE